MTGSTWSHDVSICSLECSLKKGQQRKLRDTTRRKIETGRKVENRIVWKVLLNPFACLKRVNWMPSGGVANCPAACNPKMIA